MPNNHERWAQKAMDNISDTVCLLNKDGQFIALNPACLRNWAYTEEELISKNLVDLVDPPDVALAIVSLNAARDKQEPVQFDVRMKRKDHAIISARWSVYWSESEATFFCVAKDNWLQKLEEDAIQTHLERIRTIVECLGIALITTSDDWFIEAVLNNRFQELFGYYAADIVEQHVSTLFKNDDHSLKAHQLNIALKLSEDQKLLALECVKENGETFPGGVLMTLIRTHEDTRRLFHIFDMTGSDFSVKNMIEAN